MAKDLKKSGLPDIKHLPLEYQVLWLRIMILALGECINPPWWKTNYFSGAGISFLDRLFPKSRLNAAVNSTSAAACELHDKSIGKTGSYHLFRLPSRIEMNINSAFENSEFLEIISEIELEFGNPERLLQRLSIDKDTSPEKVTGPKMISNTSGYLELEHIDQMLDIYLAAFTNGTRAFPYLEVE